MGTDLDLAIFDLKFWPSRSDTDLVKGMLTLAYSISYLAAL